jgi:two-component system sensor histidine kinase/response regulator
MASGMDDYLSKPVSVMELGKMLDRWLQKATARPETSVPKPETAKTAQTIDMEHLRHVTDNDEQGMQRLVGIYLKETRSELEQLALAVRDKNALEIRRLAHGVKGASAAYGMTQIVVYFQELEIQGRDNQLNECMDSLRKAQNEFQAIETKWKTYLENEGREKPA